MRWLKFQPFWFLENSGIGTQAVVKYLWNSRTFPQVPQILTETQEIFLSYENVAKTQAVSKSFIWVGSMI